MGNKIIMAVAGLALAGVVLFFVGGSTANVIGLILVVIAIIIAIVGNRS